MFKTFSVLVVLSPACLARSCDERENSSAARLRSRKSALTIFVHHLNESPVLRCWRWGSASITLGKWSSAAIKAFSSRVILMNVYHNSIWYHGFKAVNCVVDLSILRCSPWLEGETRRYERRRRRRRGRNARGGGAIEGSV